MSFNNSEKKEIIDKILKEQGFLSFQLPGGLALSENNTIYSSYLNRDVFVSEEDIIVGKSEYINVTNLIGSLIRTLTLEDIHAYFVNCIYKYDDDKNIQRVRTIFNREEDKGLVPIAVTDIELKMNNTLDISRIGNAFQYLFKNFNDYGNNLKKVADGFNYKNDQIEKVFIVNNPNRLRNIRFVLFAKQDLTNKEEAITQFLNRMETVMSHGGIYLRTPYNTTLLLNSNLSDDELKEVLNNDYPLR